jgi:hypothetical protein
MDIKKKIEDILLNSYGCFDSFTVDELLELYDGITNDFEPLKELAEGVVLRYEFLPPTDDVEEMYLQICKDNIERVEKYYR